MTNPYHSLQDVIFSHKSSENRILSFPEYLEVLKKNPHLQLRNSSKTLLDLFDYYGKDETSGRFHLFDQPIDSTIPRVVGHEKIQSHIYRTLRSFVKQKVNNRMILLHGPNGSAKSSLVHSIMKGLERYSETDEGASYTFSWVFPHEKITKSGIGLKSEAIESGKMDSFAKLPDDQLSARIPSALRDHPFLLIPQKNRKEFLKSMLGSDVAEKLWNELPLVFTDGELSHQNKQIFDALMLSHQGDLSQVYKYVQVERIYYSSRFREGIATIEPKMHVDAQAQQISLSKNLSQLPASLQSLNLFTMQGELVDANRGILEFSDLLKRPVDAFKYLLSICEKGEVNVGPFQVQFDVVIFGSTNEIQLDGFKEFPDFMSFKGRMELIRVPYLLSYLQEKEIYESMLKSVAGEKELSPHVAEMTALWAVLTRLKKPSPSLYPSSLGKAITELKPLEKAKFYAKKEVPTHLQAEEKKILKTHSEKMKEEYASIPYYEGRMGASAREVKTILLDAAQNRDFPCLSPLSVFRTLEDFVKLTSEYEFLRQEVKDSYHDHSAFIGVVRKEYEKVVDKEVRAAMELYDSSQWTNFIKKYVEHVSLILKNEKYRNPMTGNLEDPDYNLVTEFEKTVGAPQSGEENRKFRESILTQIAAWSLETKAKSLDYHQVFPELLGKLEKHYYDQQKGLLQKMHDALLVYGRDGEYPQNDGGKLAQKTKSNLMKLFGYSDAGAEEVILFVLKTGNQ